MTAKKQKKVYLAYSLDAFANCGPIGACCGLPAEKVSHGNLLLWQYVWRTKSDIVTTNHLIGFFFGVNPCEALLTFGHLEATVGGWRVKGAAEWLKVMNAQSNAGKTHAGNLKKGAKTPETLPAPSRLTPENGVEPGPKPAGSLPALPASSQQPLKDYAPPNGDAQVEPKPKRPSRQQAFFVEAQRIRCSKHPLLQPERADKDVAKLNASLKQPLDRIGVAGMTAAWLAYLDDAYAAARQWPWGLFISDWERHHGKTLLIGTGPPLKALEPACRSPEESQRYLRDMFGEPRESPQP